MKRFNWGPCIVAAVFSLVLAATAQAQYAYVQTSPAGQQSYGYPNGQASVYRVVPMTPYAGSYNYGQQSNGYGSVSQPYYVYNYSRAYPQPGQGYNWESRLSYASYPRAANYSRGYSITQPYYFPGHGQGTMTRSVMPNGASFRSWDPPFQVR
jgi:hypothetical protein